MPWYARAAATVGRPAVLLAALALSAQVVAHVISAGYAGSSAYLVAAVSAVPPVVVAHMSTSRPFPAPWGRTP